MPPPPATAPARVLIHDPTLRDGHHAVRHQLNADQLRAYAAAANAARVPVVEVGHGNGLGASSLQIGRSLLSDTDMLMAVREELTHSQMGVFMAPGWGTSQDLHKAVGLGADVVRIAAHCTEANVSERHVGVARELGAQTHAVLLMSHMATADQLAEQCALLESFGAQAVGIFDSAGHFLPQDVQTRIDAITAAVAVPVIFHGHNNLGMAVANSLTAVAAGARIIDATARGFGAGAGNTQLEVLVAVLERQGTTTDIDLRALLAASDIAHEHLMDTPPTIDSVSLISGLAGVFSGFKNSVLATAHRMGVNPIEVFLALGEQQVVAGQEDLIESVAARLATQETR